MGETVDREVDRALPSNLSCSTCPCVCFCPCVVLSLKHLLQSHVRLEFIPNWPSMHSTFRYLEAPHKLQQFCQPWLSWCSACRSAVHARPMIHACHCLLPGFVKVPYPTYSGSKQRPLSAIQFQQLWLRQRQKKRGQRGLWGKRRPQVVLCAMQCPHVCS